jgi:short-subunit dehydrogenase
MNKFLRDKVVLVTGASSGIGLALAKASLSRGANVAVCGRDQDRLKIAFAGADPARVLCFQADVAKEEDCRNFVQAAVAQWGRIDVLFNNAGISMRALFEELDLKVLKELMDINFWGTVYTTKAALPYVKANKGSIVGVSSIAGYRGLPARSGYSSSKFAMQGFLESLRTELLHSGVHVMWAAPGFTASNIRNVALSASGATQKETPLKESKLMTAEQCAEIILRAVQQRRRTVVMTLQGKMTVWLNKLLPGFMDRMVFNHFAAEPGSPLKK